MIAVCIMQVLVYGTKDSSESSENLETAFPISADGLEGGSFGVTVGVTLLSTMTWDDIGTVVFVEEDTSPVSVTGVVTLEGSDGSDQSTTMFENCKTLSTRDNVRVRWTVNEADGHIDIGLEGQVSPGDQLSFGPATPVCTWNHIKY
jgi:hypothetical protein